MHDEPFVQIIVRIYKFKIQEETDKDIINIVTLIFSSQNRVRQVDRNKQRDKELDYVQ